MRSLGLHPRKSSFRQCALDDPNQSRPLPPPALVRGATATDGMHGNARIPCVCRQPLYSIGHLGGQALLACGLIPIAGAAVGLLRRVDYAIQRRCARELRPLWQLLCAEFPYIELSDDRHSIAFEHVVNEISDGLAELSRYAPAAYGDTTNPQIAATVIADALRSLRGESALDTIRTPPYPPIEPELGGWRPRARWMLHVGRELDKRGILPQRGTLNDATSPRGSHLGSGHGSDHAGIERAHGAA
ncbi:DUF6545 domain-containing protein [Nocardia asiatica]|uniref:DUF6545 domain-containing protein n=1 Tax=Nocardia asiatica TaxID=209252 RepID=UPI003EE16EFC